jgi:fibronectin-binding autotransporter adhesin
MKKILTALCVCLIPAAINAQTTRTWTNNGTTNFNLNTNWSGSTVPGAPDTASFTGTGSIQPNLTANISISVLSLGGTGYTLTGDTDTSLTLSKSGTGSAGAVWNSGSGSNTISANLILSAASGGVGIGANTGGNLTINGGISITNSNLLTFRAVAANSTISLNGALSGNVAGITIGNGVDAGTVKLLAASNANTSVTTINSGVLEVSKIANGGSPSSIGTSGNSQSSLTFGNAGGTLRYVGSGDSTDRAVGIGSGGTSAIESSGSGALVFSSSSGPSYSTGLTRTYIFGGNNTGNNTVAWNMASSNLIAIQKSGEGKWIFTGNNTYTSTTIVNAGTLLVNGSHVGGGSYTVNGTFGGNGTLRLGASSVVTVNSGGSIAPGANLGEVGTLTMNGTTQSGTVANFASGATFAFDLNATAGTSDRISLLSGAANDLVFNNNVINFAVNGTLLDGQSYILFTSDVLGAYSGLTLDGNNRVTAGLSFLGLGANFQTTSYIEQVGNNLVLQAVAVPEPTTWALLAGSLTLVMILRRRRNRA